MKSSIWSALALTFVAFGPAACGSEAPPAPAGPVVPEGITVTNGRLSLPPVKGNPAAAYFDISNAGPRDHMIRAAAVKGAKGAMFHQMGTWNLKPSMDEIFQVNVKAKETVKFEPGGMHVMVDGLDDTLKAGTKTDVTLTFVGGDQVTFPAEVRKAGDDR
jgi:copper(I)-binding protein